MINYADLLSLTQQKKTLTLDLIANSTYSANLSNIITIKRPT